MKKFFEKYFWLIVILIILADLFLRLWHLNYPNWAIFDEIYYPKYANNYLHHEVFFDVHPPLGKMLIAFSIYFLGDNFWGWRMAEVIFGTGLLVIIFLFAQSLFKSRLISLLALVLASFCPMIFVESRLGLINIFLAFFVSLGVYLFWLWYQSKNKWYLLFAFISLSLASSVKWTGFLAVMGFVIFMIISSIIDKSTLDFLKNHRWWVIFSLIVFSAIYVGIFYIFPKSNQFPIEEWHRQALGFHLNLKAGHPYASRWWTWPLGVRPLWLEFKKVSDTLNATIIEIVNVPLMYLSIVAFIYGLYLTIVKNNRALMLLCVMVIVLYFPWAFVKRVTFLYLFLPVVPLLIILSSKFLFDLGTILKNKRLSIFILILIAGFFIYFSPLLFGQPISYQNYNSHMWFRNWY